MPQDYGRVEVVPEVTGAEAPATPEETPTTDTPVETPVVTDPPAETSEVAARPGWLPKKFTTAEDMAAAYLALERSQSAATAAAAVAAETTTETPAEGTVETTETPPAIQRIDLQTFSPYFDEYRTTGRLAEQSYAEIEEKYGLPRDLVDGYINGQQATAEQAARGVHDAVGGKASYEAMVEGIPAAVSAGRITSAEVESYNRLLETGDAGAISMAARGLAAAVGAKPARAPGTPLIAGTRSGNSGSAPFANTEQVVAAMRDPRYKKDSEYRAEVDRRLAASEVFGQPIG